MEVFGSRHMYAFNYMGISSSKENYLFMFEKEPDLDLEKVTFPQLLDACDGLMLVMSELSGDKSNLVFSKNIFLPKYCTITRGPLSAKLVNTSNANISTSTPQHLVYVPEKIHIQNEDQFGMIVYECFYPIDNADYSAWAKAAFTTGTDYIEYVFDRPVEANCFVLSQATTKYGVRIEALVGEEWVVLANNFLVGDVTGAVRFADTLASRFRIKFAASSSVSISAAYFGKLDFTDEDKYVRDFNFTKAILCPSQTLGHNTIRAAVTYSIMDTSGYDLYAVPCMLMDVGIETHSDLIITKQDSLEPNLGIFLMGGYLL